MTLGLPDNTRGCLFDLDGVLTQTATVHAKAWQQTFDTVLRDYADRTSGAFVPFDIDADYTTYVDGKPREDGVRDFLAARGLHPPEGTPDDGPDADTIYGIGTRKNNLVQKLIRRDGVEVYAGSRTYLERVAAAGLRRAVVSSSANTAMVLEVTGLTDLVEARVDGLTLATEHLAGKPAPDSFQAGAQLLGLSNAQCVVFEDALAGVQAGHAAGSYTVGVDRVRDGAHGPALRAHGADVVVRDLADLLTDGDSR